MGEVPRRNRPGCMIINYKNSYTEAAFSMQNGIITFEESDDIPYRMNFEVRDGLPHLLMEVGDFQYVNILDFVLTDFNESEIEADEFAERELEYEYLEDPTFDMEVVLAVAQ